MALQCNSKPATSSQDTPFLGSPALTPAAAPPLPHLKVHVQRASRLGEAHGALLSQHGRQALLPLNPARGETPRGRRLSTARAHACSGLKKQLTRCKPRSAAPGARAAGRQTHHNRQRCSTHVQHACAAAAAVWLHSPRRVDLSSLPPCCCVRLFLGLVVRGGERALALLDPPVQWHNRWAADNVS